MKLLGSQPVAAKALKLAPELEAVQDLMPIGTEDRAKLKASIKSNGIRDHLKGYETAKGKFVLAGATRLQIAQELGLATVPFQIYDFKNVAERQEFAITENLERRHLSGKQKRALVEHLLNIDPSRSNVQIGKKAGVNDKTVAVVRRDLEAASEIPSLKDRKGSDGKTYSAPQKPTRAHQKPPALRSIQNRIMSNEDLFERILSDLKDLQVPNDGKAKSNDLRQFLKISKAIQRRQEQWERRRNRQE